MEYDMLQRKKDLFPNMIADACRVLTGWKNLHYNKDNNINDAKDGVTFITTKEE